MTDTTRTMAATPTTRETRPSSTRAADRGGPWRGRSLRAWVTFLAVVMSILGSVHYYLIQRLVLDVQPGAPWQLAGIAALALLGVATVATLPLSRLLPRERARLVTWPAYGWMGLMFLLLVGFAASDLLLGIAGLAGLLPRDDPGAMLALDRGQALAVLGLALATAIAGLFAGLRTPAVRRVEIPLEGWPDALDGLRVVQLSDLHIGPTLGRRFAERVVARTNALQPDLVVVTGDLVDGTVPELAAEVEPLSDLRARLGVYAVTGNHDYYSGPGPWLEEFERLGLTVLGNRRVALGDGDARFELAGVHDRQGRGFGAGHGEDLEQALEGHDPATPTVLLAHQPPIFDRAAARGVDLQLSGHTHGGQILPFAILTRSLYSRYVAGLYRKDRSALYVHRGTGFWGPPIRVLVPSEITELTLRSA